MSQVRQSCKKKTMAAFSQAQQLQSADSITSRDSVVMGTAREPTFSFPNALSKEKQYISLAAPISNANHINTQNTQS